MAQSGMTLIKGGRLIDPSQGIDGIHDLLVEDGVVKGHRPAHRTARARG